MRAITGGCCRRWLNTIEFRSDNRFQPLTQALAAIQRAFGSHHRHFPEDVPTEGIVTRSWQAKVFEDVKGKRKINRHYYELCVLEARRRGQSVNRYIIDQFEPAAAKTG